MPEMLAPGAALVGARLGQSVPLITDGRFSGAQAPMERATDRGMQGHPTASWWATWSRRRHAADRLRSCAPAT